MEKIFYEVLNEELTPIKFYKGENFTPVWIQAYWTEGEFSNRINSNGCGHVCSAMALNLNGVKITPYEFYMHCRELFGAPTGEDTPPRQSHFLSASGVQKAITSYGVKAELVKICKNGEKQAIETIINALKQDKEVIMWSHPSEEFIDNPFSTGEHWILLIGLTEDGKVIVANSSIKAKYEKDMGVQIVGKETVRKALYGNDDFIDMTWGELDNLYKNTGFVIVG